MSSQAYVIGEHSRWSRCKWGAVAEADEIGEQRWSGHKWGAFGSDHAWLVLTSDVTAGKLSVHQGMGYVQYAGLIQTWWRRRDFKSKPMSEVKRELSCATLYWCERKWELPRSLHHEESCRCRTARVGEWGGCSWSDWSYF